MTTIMNPVVRRNIIIVTQVMIRTPAKATMMPKNVDDQIVIILESVVSAIIVLTRVIMAIPAITSRLFHS